MDEGGGLWKAKGYLQEAKLWPCERRIADCGCMSMTGVRLVRFLCLEVVGRREKNRLFMSYLARING